MPPHGLNTLKFTEEKKPKHPDSGLQIVTSQKHKGATRQGRERGNLPLNAESPIVINTILSPKKSKFRCTVRKIS